MKRLLISIGAAMLLALFMVIPDWLYAYAEPTFYRVTLRTFKEWGIWTVLLLGVVTLPSLRWKLAVWTGISLLSLTGMLHFAFFHGYLMPYEIATGMSQVEEIVESLRGIGAYAMLPTVIWVCQLLAGWALLYTVKHKTAHWRVSGFFLALAFLAVPVSAYFRHNVSVLMPKNTTLSSLNTYNALALFLGKELPKRRIHHASHINYRPYEIERKNVKLPSLAVVVMGESLGYKYMHLYGYEKPDTPLLDKRKEDSAFAFAKAISCGVDTLTAVPSFFLLKREPDNVALLGRNTTNLFALAKKQGFTTHYWTTQKLNIMAPYLADADDVRRFKGYDTSMLHALEKLDTRKRHFVVIHQRNSHSPYEHSTPPRFYRFAFDNQPYAVYMRNSYANSVLFTDWLLDKMIEVVSRWPSAALIVTSDHAEMMGMPEEHGRFGHSFLDKEVAKVPAMLYLRHLRPEVLKRFRRTVCMNHYKLGLTVADILGFDVKNPNDDGIYFIQGTAIDGSNGYIRYDEQTCRNWLKEKT